MSPPTPRSEPEVRGANLIKQMAAEKTIILSTHILEEVEAICTRIIIISPREGRGGPDARRTPRPPCRCAAGRDLPQPHANRHLKRRESGKAESGQPPDGSCSTISSPTSHLPLFSPIQHCSPPSRFPVFLRCLRFRHSSNANSSGTSARPSPTSSWSYSWSPPSAAPSSSGGFFDANIASLDTYFEYLPWLFIVFVPAAGMRLWAEERRSGTIELLFTLPVTTLEAVIAKFLAAWAFLCLSILLSFPMVLTVNYLGDPDPGHSSFPATLVVCSWPAATSGLLPDFGIHENQVISFVISVFVCSCWSSLAGACSPISLAAIWRCPPGSWISSQISVSRAT